MFTTIDYSTVANALGTIKDGRKTIFDRLGHTEDAGQPIALRSHALRHYLNLLAQMGGMTSTEIAIFSGRKDERQNRAYDHMTSDEVQAPISRALKDGYTINIVPYTSRSLAQRSEFKGLGVLAAHATEYGWCRHSFASEPCQLYRDCLNCEEQVCVKGEVQKEENLRRLKDEVEYLLGQAKIALSADEYGADVWVAHQTKTLERVLALLSIFEDATVPQGAEISLDTSTPALIQDNSGLAAQALLSRRRSKK